ncbi:MAG: DUF2520 domain-containing protein [Blastocatellia bacterium]|nr:DUF2520 domain-containing protein [Blastocatellia bacterium]
MRKRSRGRNELHPSRFSIIGAGRVGQTLGRLAREAGYEIGDVVCRSERSARSAVRFIGAGRPQTSESARLSQADFILISTPDDKIPDAVSIVERNIAEVGRAVVLHTSGALSSAVLGPLAGLGLSAGSCHPLQAFADPARSLALVSDCYFCIEGDPKAVTVARRFVRSIGARSFEISADMKNLYHAAAVMASGGLVALLSTSLDMLSHCGLSEAEAIKVLLPLVEGTIANLRAVGPARALSGPVRRGDLGTVEKNLRAIASVNADWLRVYRLLAERSLPLAERAGADKESLAELRRILNE